MEYNLILPTVEFEDKLQDSFWDKCEYEQLFIVSREMISLPSLASLLEDFYWFWRALSSFLLGFKGATALPLASGFLIYSTLLFFLACVFWV